MFGEMSPVHERASRGEALERRVAAFRKRAIAITVIRGALASSAGVAFAAIVAGAAVGPIVSRPVALFAWIAAAATGLVLAAAFVRGAGALRKDRAVTLVARADASLGQAARSALELHRRPDPATSAELAEAHLARVLEALREVRPEMAMPFWPSISRPLSLFAVAGVALLAALLTDGRASAGIMALARAPFHVDEGYAIGEVVRELRVDVTAPDYRDEPPLRGLTAPHVEGLAGSTFRFEIEPRIDATAAVLRVGSHRLELERQPSGAFRGSVALDEGGPVIIRMRTRSGEWIEDLRGRSIRILPDPLPEVALEALFDEDEPGERVALRWNVRDDHGIAEIRLVTEVEGLPPKRRKLSEESGSPKEKRGLESLDLRELGAEPGDSVTLVLEARDRGRPPEARFARSEPVVLTLPSPESERERNLSILEEALARTLDALADRLEEPRTSPLDARRERRAMDSLSRVPPALERAVSAVSGADAPLVRKSLHAIRDAYHRETLELARKIPNARALAKLEDSLVSALEDGALLLDDLRARARLEDFQEVALELEALRREIASLLAEYARTNDPEVKHALGRAIHRAKKKLEALKQRMSESSSAVPREFVNAGESAQRESERFLEELEAAVAEDAIADAEAKLLALERELHAMAEAFGKGESEVAESRFGPRQRALAEAIDRVRGLEAEEVELAREHGELRRALAERALRALGDATKVRDRERVESALDTAKKDLEAMKRDVGGIDEDIVTRIQGRIDDVRAALDQGDLGEASKMAREANAEAMGLARDLSLRATMFPGRSGEVRRAAESAERLAESVAKLHTEVERAIPDLERHLRPSDVKALERLASRHRAVERAAQEVAQSLAEGPDGTPLSEEGASELRRAAGMVDRGARSAAEHDAVVSSESASRAADALRKTREILEEHQRSSSSGEGGGSGRSSGASASEKVVIPGREERPEDERRRRIRDGLREEPPPDYRDAVKRYFEALLR